MIHQELQPIPVMTIAENLFLGNYPLNKFRMVDHDAMNKQTKSLLDEVGVHINPKTLLQ